MLNDYKESQAIAYNLMMNEISSNHLSHAYLFDENNANESFDIVMAFIKEILGNKLENEERNQLFKRIDDGNYGEIKIIEPDGMLIKKRQILDLQQEFSLSAIEGSKRIYIIRDADKMRSETANSMLKFLEEPNEGIIAILMTNNFNGLLPTIVSRCQIIRLNNNSNGDFDNEYNELCINFITFLENSGIKTIYKEQELLFDTIGVKEREKYIIFFDKLIDMYYDILKISNGVENIRNSNYFDNLKAIAMKNNPMRLLDKIDMLIEMKDTIKNNVNINLLIDSLIVSVGGTQ